MPQSFTCLHYHLIFSTKNRLPFITSDLQSRLYEYIGGILRNNGSVLIAAGGMPDHIHLLVRLNKQLAVSDALRLIKTNSSKWVHDSFPEHQGFAWQEGFGAFTVSLSGLPDVKDYLAHQEEHHRQRTFKEEFMTILKKHGIEFNEAYLWD